MLRLHNSIARLLEDLVNYGPDRNAESAEESIDSDLLGHWTGYHRFYCAAGIPFLQAYLLTARRAICTGELMGFPIN